MAIQNADALVLDALSILHDLRPNQHQPVLDNGIHLRWFPGPDRGFPKGYYLFRRRTGEGTNCVIPQLQQSNVQSVASQTTLDTGIGTLTQSPGNLVPLAADPASAAGIAGFTLTGQLTFTLPANQQAGQFIVRLRFRSSAGGVKIVATFGADKIFEQTYPAPPEADWSFAVTANTTGVDTIAITELSAAVDLVDLCWFPAARSRSAGLFAAGSTTLPGRGWEPIPTLNTVIALPLTHPQYPAYSSAESVDGAAWFAKPRVKYGTWADSFQAAARSAGPGSVTLANGSAIALGTGGTNWTAELIGKLICIPAGAADYSAYAVMSVLAPDRIVLSRAYLGPPQFRVAYELLDGDDFAEMFDRLACLVQSPDGMRAAASPPALDAGTVAGGRFVRASGGSAVVQGIATQWTASLAGTSIEIGPSRCGGTYFAASTSYRILSVDTASQITLDRPFAGSPSIPTDGDYRIIARAGGDGSDAGAQALQFKPMDLIELAALLPGYAQALGLYCIDTAVWPGETYDYIVLADHLNAFSFQPAKALSWLNDDPVFSGDTVDAYVATGVQYANTPELAPPGQMELFRLPAGGARISLAHPNRASSDAAICVHDAASWKNPPAGQPAPVMVNVWRLPRGTNAAQLALDDPSAYQDAGKMVPTLTAAVSAPQLPAGWPSAPIHFIDSGPDGTGLDVGWYSYRANTIDMFGRWSRLSNPLPWTVVPPAVPASAEAVHLDDRLPPPPPAGVLAWMLDDDDPYLLRDAAYVAWKNTFAPNAPPPGLRVTWRWPWPHRNQGPDLREFRIYLQSRPLNARTGRITAVVPAAQSDRSVVTLELGSTAGIDQVELAANAYYNADLQAGDRSFRIAGGQAGNPAQLTVINGGSTANERPESNVDGAVVFPAAHALHKELLDPSNWPSWLAAVPANIASTKDDVELVKDPSSNVGLEGTAATLDATTHVLSLNANVDLSNVVVGTDLLYLATAGANLGDLQYFHTIEAVDTTAHTVTLGPALAGPPPIISSSAATTTAAVSIGARHTVPPPPAGLAWKIGWPVRHYEVFLPNPAQPAVQTPANLNVGALLSPSLAQPVVYGSVGVSSADWRDEVDDRYFPARNRKGNESFVAAPATVFRVLRDLPAPPAYTWKSPLLATKANYKSESYFTVRWNNAGAGYFAHVFRAMDSSLFLALWNLKPSPAIAVTGAPVPFPAFLTVFTAHRAQYDAHTAAAALAAAQAEYQAAVALFATLDDASLFWLAGRAELVDAYMQITITPLDLADPANADRLGPDDDPATYVKDTSACAYVDTLPGRSANKYFYRVMFLDGAQNRSPLGNPSPPVYVPNVVPPRTPVVTKVLGGERQITITWAPNREQHLAGYHVYRTEDRARAQDARSMQLVATVAPGDSDPKLRGPVVVWTDANLIGGKTFFYRVGAVDASGNDSLPTAAFSARVVDTSVPDVPKWGTVGWVLLDAAGAESGWPAGGVVLAGHTPAIRLEWLTTDNVSLTRTDAGPNAKPISLADTRPGPNSVISYDTDVTPAGRYVYGIRAYSATGLRSSVRTVAVERPV